MKPLPPEIMDPLKPYVEKMFEEDNKDLIRFLDEFRLDFNSNNTEYINVNYEARTIYPLEANYK